MLKRRKETTSGHNNSPWSFISEPEISSARCVIGDSDDNDTVSDQEIETMEMATTAQDVSPPRKAFRISSRGDTSGIPKFARSEITLSNCVGKGGFSLVFEISRITLEEVYDTSERQAADRKDVADECSDEYDTSGRTNKFAMKMLRDDLAQEEHTKGVIDLAVEARFLKRLSHPNIISLRGTANSDPLEGRFFVILDRLVGTLEDELQTWRKEINKTLSIWCGPFGYCCANRPVLQKVWIERLTVARKIAGAIEYLHSEDIIYRDLKPENIGYARDGELKIFDFGLAKRLVPDDKTPSGLYHLTANTGSLRYMAPEVALGQPYDLRADTYSFAIVFWQICSLTVPYAGHNVQMHADLVVSKGERPKLERSWPTPWRELMQMCWSQDIIDRVDFIRIVATLDTELEVLTNKQSTAKDIKYKKKKKEKVEMVGLKPLDTDTRINTEGQEYKGDMNIV